MFPLSKNFADLSETLRTALLKSIEKLEFVEKPRTHTILAYFGNPQVGCKLMGRDPAMSFEPLGFYDAEISHPMRSIFCGGGRREGARPERLRVSKLLMLVEILFWVNR